ncbi:hypothetical protein D3C72_1988690 [compost metagenome]
MASTTCFIIRSSAWLAASLASASPAKGACGPRLLRRRPSSRTTFMAILRRKARGCRISPEEQGAARR